MNSITRHSLVHAAITAGITVAEKSASATPQQNEVLCGVWPTAEQGLSKQAQLSQVIAAGLMVEEADASLNG